MPTQVIEDPHGPSDLVQGPIMNGKYGVQLNWGRIESTGFSAENACKVPRGIHWYVKLWVESAQQQPKAQAFRELLQNTDDAGVTNVANWNTYSQSRAKH